MNFTDVFRSIQETGGASYNMTTGILNPETGYMVPIAWNHEEKYTIPQNLFDFSVIVKAYLANHWDKIMDSPEWIFIGFWLHEGQLYIDLAENIQDFEEAYEAGFDREQKAIYDCTNKRDITITYLYPY
jgi:hypothetical protein